MSRLVVGILLGIMLFAGAVLAENTTVNTLPPSNATTASATVPQDMDVDGVIDEKDVCPGTPPGSIIVDPLANLNYAGCTCQQVRELVDATNPCISMYCFQTLLQIKYDAVESTLVDCPDDYCEGYTYHDYPKDGYTACVNGQLRTYQCEPKLVPNATVCGYVAPVLSTTADNLTVNATAVQPGQNATVAITSPLPPTPAASETLNSTPALSTRTYYLTDATINYSYPETIREGDDAFFRLQFSTSQARTSIDPHLTLLDGQEIPLIDVNCTDAEEGTYVCIGTWRLPTDKVREEDLSLTFDYTTKEGVVSEDIAVPLMVKKPAFTANPVDEPVIKGKEPKEEILARAIYDEYAEQESPRFTSAEEFLDKMEQTSLHVMTDKKTTYDAARNKTKVTITIRPNTGVIANNITIIEYIPKEMARSVAELTFSTAPTLILNDDPLVMWNFATVDERIDISYELSGNVPTTGNTIVVADNLTNKQSPWFIVIPMLMIPLLVILLIFVPRMLAHQER